MEAVVQVVGLQALVRIASSGSSSSSSSMR
jgi:hypothetical protein